MNTSLLFKNAILNLYKARIYTVDFAILKASDYADKNKITAEDYEELLTYLAEEQAKSMQVVEQVQEETEVIEDNTEEVAETETAEKSTEENVEVEE